MVGKYVSSSSSSCFHTDDHAVYCLFHNIARISCKQTFNYCCETTNTYPLPPSGPTFEPKVASLRKPVVAERARVSRSRKLNSTTVHC